MANLHQLKGRVLSPDLIASLRGQGAAQPSAVLMFSGGRDSTLAAIRMHQEGLSPALVTVASWHLVGIDRVRKRIADIQQQVPELRTWFVIRQPTELKTDTSFYEKTCLPCHHAYVVVAAAVAAKLGIGAVAFGYARYQDGWPEQTPLAISRLRDVLLRHRIKLLLPVYDLESRSQATGQLRAYGQSPDALEQKCTQQVTNVKLDENRLRQQIDLWEKAIDTSMSALAQIEIELIEMQSGEHTL